VSIPLDAVLEEGGRTFVRRADGREQDVVLGPRNRDHVVVEEGLAEGDAVRLRLLEPSPDAAGDAGP
jgi:multidrug efflux pump subunit AcrA (membrane-fusion protein)